MTLRRKTFIIIGITLIGLLGVLYLTSSSVLLKGYRDLEQQTTSQNLQRVQAALTEEINNLSVQTNDYAQWDDTYNFLQTHNEDYTLTNFTIDTYSYLKLNIIIVVDNNYNILYHGAYNPDEGVISTAPESLIKQLSSDSVLLKHTDTESRVSGLLLLPETPVFIASRPVRTSAGTGPIMGSLIFGRYLNQAKVQQLSQLTNININLFSQFDPTLPVDYQRARTALSGGNLPFIQPMDKQTIAGYISLNDINNQPILLLRIDSPRDIYRQGEIGLRALMFSLILISFVYSGVTLLLLNNLILKPLVKLSHSASVIAQKGNFIERIPTKGEDELTSLATAINGLLQTLEQHSQQIERSYDADRRLAQYHSATEVSRILMSSMNEIKILEQVPTLLQNRFELYFVGVFLIDESGEYAVLRTGSQNMLPEGFRLSVGGSSTTGWVTANRQPRVYQSETRDEELNIIRLPLSRSELSVPLITQNKILGALTLQSTRPGAFDENDISIYQVIASNLAIALENADKLHKIQTELDEIQTLHRQYLSRTWAEVSRIPEGLSFTYEDNKQAEKSENQNIIEIPVELRGQEIGQLTMEVEQDALSPQELTLVQAITSEAATTLESIRLLEDTQRRAERERLVAQITRAVRASTDVETVLMNAIRELGRSLRASEGEIRLRSTTDEAQ